MKLLMLLLTIFMFGCEPFFEDGACHSFCKSIAPKGAITNPPFTWSVFTGGMATCVVLKSKCNCSYAYDIEFTHKSIQLEEKS